MARPAAHLYPGRTDHAVAIADFPSITGLQLRHQGRKQTCKDFRRTTSIGGRERRPRNRATPEMIELAGMTFPARFNLANAARTAQLRIHRGAQMSLVCYGAMMLVSVVLRVM